MLSDNAATHCLTKYTQNYTKLMFIL